MADYDSDLALDLFVAEQDRLAELEESGYPDEDYFRSLLEKEMI